MGQDSLLFAQLYHELKFPQKKMKEKKEKEEEEKKKEMIKKKNQTSMRPQRMA